MKTLLLAAALFAAAAAPAQDAKKEAEPRKEESVKCSIDRLDKAWGLTLKGLTVREVSTDFVGGLKQGSARPFCEVRVTLEFGKDANSKAVAQAFDRFNNLIPIKERPAYVQFYLLDEDSVVIGKYYLERTEGEITGTEGDAFRAVLMIDPATYKKTKKIDVRVPEVEK